MKSIKKQDNFYFFLRKIEKEINTKSNQQMGYQNTSLPFSLYRFILNGIYDTGFSMSKGNIATFSKCGSINPPNYSSYYSGTQV